jgi:hypothetical protein
MKYVFTESSKPSDSTVWIVAYKPLDSPVRDRVYNEV